MNKLILSAMLLSSPLLTACGGGDITANIDDHNLIADGADVAPEVQATSAPIITPTAVPISVATSVPVTPPVVTPVIVPTATPETVPTATPVIAPTTTPETVPTATPVTLPTATPAITPTATPVITPTAVPVATATPSAVTTPAPTPSAVATPAPTASESPEESTAEDDSASYAKYVSGNSYAAGDQVSHAGSVYECLIAGWCSSAAAAYEPGAGFAWQSAWLLLGQDDSSAEPDSGDSENTDQNNSDAGGPIIGDSGDGADSGSEDNSQEVITEEGVFEQPSIRACLPDGLYITPQSNPNLCDIYDEDGREIMANDHPRRIIGYFTSWRTGKNNQPSYLVNDIPWDKITHINYAFAHIDSSYQISVGDITDSENPATGLTWDDVPGAEMDSDYSFNGHFNLLAKYKKQYTDVKTLISVGGWAETGGHFDDDGRNADGGFYSLTIKDNGEINYQAIDTFAESVVDFLRTYKFDGVDIDYEYPTSMAGSGNPDDAEFSEPRRNQLWAGYMALMKSLRASLDNAGEEDNTHYMLTIASPSSGYLLRGMEAFQAVKYLDYVNIMSYDLHGAWNEFVGPNAALFDDGKDAELAKWNVYSTTQYEGIGYLNTDWAYHYFRGALAAGRINVGIPYYTRGWQNVSGGTNGLWGTAPATADITCPAGTGNSCGYGAQGIDNLWHDLDADGNELFAGSNPLWHTMNLQAGISGSYLADYGLNPQTEDDAKLVGSYDYYYDSTLVASWLWNQDKKVFLSIEDETSYSKKLDWVIANGIGGVMMWELAGDYEYDVEKGEYFMGQTLTNLAYEKLSAADNYGAQTSTFKTPVQAIDVAVSIGDFAAGDSNYPIAPTLTITNNSDMSLPGGSLFEFDMGTSTSADIIDQSGVGLLVIDDQSNAAGNNTGGLTGDHHRVQLALPSWQTLSPGASVNITIRYYLPAAMPSNWTVEVDNELYAIPQEQPNLPILKSF